MTDLAHLQELAELQFAAEQEIVRLEDDLRIAKQELRILSEQTIPDAMEELDILEFKTATGMSISVGRSLSVGKLTNPAALRWLEENGHAGMIKSDISVPFSRGDKDDAAALVAKLQEDGLAPRMQEHVHAQTIKSFLRSQLEEGAAIDLTMFGAYERPVAKIKL